MVIQVRLDVPIETDGDTASKVARGVATEMNLQVSRVKVREDVVQLYGVKVVEV